MAQQVQVWKTSDGSYHETQREAENYEVRQIAKRKHDKIISELSVELETSREIAKKIYNKYSIVKRIMEAV